MRNTYSSGWFQVESITDSGRSFVEGKREAENGKHSASRLRYPYLLDIGKTAYDDLGVVIWKNSVYQVHGKRLVGKRQIQRGGDDGS